MKKKTPAAAPTPGMSRGRRGMFLRIPVELYNKLRRIAASNLSPTGDRATIQGTVIGLIEQAREKRARGATPE